MTWAAELQRYERHLKGTNRRPSNRASILGYLRALGERYEPDSYLALAPEDVSGFLGEMRENGLRGTKGLAENTLKSVLSRIRTFIRFLGRGRDEQRRQMAEDLLEAIRPSELFAHSKITSRVRSRSDLLTPEEMERFLAVCDGGKRAIFSVLWWSGCRPSEVLRLKQGDVNFGVHKSGRSYVMLSIRDPKTDESRDEPVGHPEALEALRHWLDVAPDKEWLFPSPYGGHLKYQALWAYMKRAAKRAGLEKNAYPYLLRHGAGTRRFSAPPEIWTALQGSNERDNYIRLASEQALDWVMEHEAGEPTINTDALARIEELEARERIYDAHFGVMTGALYTVIATYYDDVGKTRAKKVAKLLRERVKPFLDALTPEELKALFPRWEELGL